METSNENNELRQQMGNPNTGVFSTGSSLNTSAHASRITFADNYSTAMVQALELRKQFQIMEPRGSSFEDLTPPLLEDDYLKEKLDVLNTKIRLNAAMMYIISQRSTLQQASSQRMPVNMKTSLDDIALSAASSLLGPGMELPVRGEPADESEEDKQAIDQEPARVLPFIKIILRKTREVVLFEQRSTTVAKGTDEARTVEEDNKYYDYITVGKGRVRRTDESEAQTTDVLYKSRDANTQSIHSATVISYVSNFEMFDTYRNLESTTTSVAVGDEQHMNVTTYTVGGVDQYSEISRKPNFKLALMVTLRILASNVFEMEQRRFRNMIMPDPLSRDFVFKYSLKLLFRFNPQATDRTRKAVADLAFCPGNGDIFAVAYGIYSFGAMHVPESGYCCVWNIKNPVNPERIFFYNVPVVSVQFSPFLPQLLAIGLYDGSVEVRNITNFGDAPIAMSLRTETSTCDAITAMEWIPQPNITGKTTVDIEPLLALSQDGSVTKFRVINSPHLLAYPQIQLDRVEGSPEGLPVRRVWNQAQSNRFPQGLNLTLHPRQQDTYFILTDEGCLHRCSTNYPHQHLEVLQVHTGSVNVMDFSPWSPKLYLTAGNDWCIRIWMEGILEPLITLQHETGPIHCAAWSKTHSTVIVSNTRKAISIWDIRRSTLKPVSSTTVDKSHYTLFKFSRCGRSIAMGNERGNILMLGFEDMPFAPHFQYDELELAIYRAIATKTVLTTELKNVGFFGYPEFRRNRKHRCT